MNDVTTETEEIVELYDIPLRPASVYRVCNPPPNGVQWGDVPYLAEPARAQKLIATNRWAYQVGRLAVGDIVFDRDSQKYYELGSTAIKEIAFRAAVLKTMSEVFAPEAVEKDLADWEAGEYDSQYLAAFAKFPSSTIAQRKK